MAIPFPSPTFIPNPPYPLKAWVSPGGKYTAALFFRTGFTAPTNVTYWDQNDLQFHVATIASNDGKTTLQITTEGTTKTFNIAGDGTANLPIASVLSP